MSPSSISPAALKAATDHAETPRLTRFAWMTLYRDTNSAKTVCSIYGISRKTFYKWLGRYMAAKGDPASLQDQSRRPKSHPRATPQETVIFILQIRERTGFGPRRLKAYLSNNHGIKISERTIWKILKRNSKPAA